MTLEDFIKKYDGKFVEVAGSIGAENQCVDLANAYIRDVLNLPIIEWTNAIDFPSKAGSNYKYILNTPSGVPKTGDLVIWGYKPYGHIAIFVNGGANKFNSFDQNFPLNTKCHLQEHNYSNVLGWLRPIKSPTQGNTESEKDKKIEELEKEKDKFEKLSIKQSKTITTMTHDAEELSTQVSSLKIQLDVFRELSDGLSEEVRELKVSVEKALDKAEEWEASYTEIETQLTEANNKYQKQLGEIERLKAENTILHTANVNFASYLTATKLFKYKNYSVILLENLKI